MTVLITGANSYVGTSVYTVLQKKHHVIGTYYSNPLFPEFKFLDVTDIKQVMEVVSSIKPDYILHIAANSSMQWCEKKPELAFKINVEGTQNIVNSANMINSKVLFFSSFLADAPKDSIYGKTKFIGEQYVKKTLSGHIIIRPSLIVGVSPNSINSGFFNNFLSDISNRKSALCDNSSKFQFSWLKHINEVVEQVIQREILNETISVSVPEINTLYTFAKDISTTFNMTISAEEQRAGLPVFLDDLAKLTELKLPQYTYTQLISGVTEEITTYLKRF